MNKSRRITASIIDYLLIVIVFSLLFSIISVPDWFLKISFHVANVPVTLPSIGALVILAPILLKDFLFINASIGKKLMKLEIRDLDGKIPPFRKRLLRGALMPTLGYVVFICNRFSVDYIVEWEKTRIGTMVCTKDKKKSR